MTESIDAMREQLRNHIASLRERATSLEKELTDIRAQTRSAEETLRGLDALDRPGQGVSTKEWSASVEDIKDCENVRQALIKMASLNDGILRPSPAARVLIDAGFTESKDLARVTPGVYARLRGRSDWEHSGRGEFRYLLNPED